LEPQVAELQNRLKQLQIQLFNKEKELIAAQTSFDKPAAKEEIEKRRVKAESQKTTLRLPRTPLEKIELSQIKLIAIIMSKSGNRALVEEHNGKGYVIKEGTYIGVNSGKVSKILRDRIIVEEEIIDKHGDVIIKKKELILPEPPGTLGD
jgi:type IV pilus assembly protein PilP